VKHERGSTMVEASLVTVCFLFLIVGITDFGRLGFAYNSITYATHLAARFAATNGSASGHAASAATIQSNVTSNLVGLNSAALTVTVTWTPNNNPGSQVQVTAAYNFKPLLIPISATTIALRSRCTETIAQ